MSVSTIWSVSYKKTGGRTFSVTCFLLCLRLEPVLDFMKEVFAVALKLGLAHARNIKEFAVVFWQTAAHIGEGSV